MCIRDRSRGGLIGTSGEAFWEVQESPGELSLGPRGRRFGSSEGVSGGAQIGVQMESQMASQSGIPQDLENVDFDKELVTFSLLPDPLATLTGTLARTVPKMLFIYPRLLGRIQVPGVARNITKQPGHSTPTTRR